MWWQFWKHGPIPWTLTEVTPNSFRAGCQTAFIHNKSSFFFTDLQLNTLKVINPLLSYFSGHLFIFLVFSAVLEVYFSAHNGGKYASSLHEVASTDKYACMLNSYFKTKEWFVKYWNPLCTGYVWRWLNSSQDFERALSSLLNIWEAYKASYKSSGTEATYYNHCFEVCLRAITAVKRMNFLCGVAWRGWYGWKWQKRMSFKKMSSFFHHPLNHTPRRTTC